VVAADGALVKYAYTSSPFGDVLLAASDAGLRIASLHAKDGPMSPHTDWVHDPVALEEPVRQLGEYFRGDRRAFDLPLDLAGTPFQRSVWNALLEIPYGRVISYGELARRLGKPRAVRAVGAANGANKICVIVPCHRVVGADGGLVGYGGGLSAKRELLALERGTPPTQATLF